MKSVLRITLTAVFTIAATALAGCGDVVANQGNLGNLVYALFTTYNVEETELTKVSLITGVQHRIVVTEAPDANIRSGSQIVHRLAPDAGTTITTEPVGSDDGIGDAILRVDVPNEYTLQSWNGTELIDYIALKFVDAEKLDVQTYLRTPADVEFNRAAGEIIPVPVWTQATFIAAPVDSEGNRLVGDIGLEITVDPADAMIQVYNLQATYENEIWESDTPLNMLFVQTGTIEVTLTEPLTGLFSTIQFNVTEESIPAE